MLSEELQKIAAREVLAIAGMLLLAIALKMCLGFGNYPFRWIVAGVYLTRWVWWALAKCDRNRFRQNMMILAFAGGLALLVNSVLNIAALVNTQQLDGLQPGLVATILLPATVGAAAGVLLVRWALRRRRRGMQPES